MNRGEFADEAPELARFGRERLANRVGYLGTIRAAAGVLRAREGEAR
jgi:hypothetical protein